MRKPRTRKEMVEYLGGHFRYHTMNSWNQSTSYAVCIKVHRLGLTGEQANACLDIMQTEDCYENSGFSRILRQFSVDHPEWDAGANGRSYGYVVLYKRRLNKRGKLVCYPGLNTDMGEDFEKWETSDLRWRTDIVWAFDRMCRQAVKAFVEYAIGHKAVETEVLVPKTIFVAERRPTSSILSS